MSNPYFVGDMTIGPRSSRLSDIISDISLLPPPFTRARKVAIAILVLVPIAFGSLAVLLGPDTNWDLRNYHWYNAYAWLTGRIASGIDFMPSQGQFFFNPLGDVPFYWLATHLPLRTACFILGTVQGLNFSLLFMLAYRCLVIPEPIRKTAVCSGLAALGALSAMGISEIGTVFQDNTTSLGILLAALLLLRHLEHLLSAPPAKVAALALFCGLPAGMMAGLKLTNVSYCIGLCIALLFISGDVRRTFMLSFCFGLGVLAGFAVTGGSWAYHLYIQYGSPVFPFYNMLFHSPLLTLNILPTYPTPLNYRFFIFPFAFGFDPYLVNEIRWRDWRFPILYALVILLTLHKILPKRMTSLWTHRGSTSIQSPDSDPTACPELVQALPSRFLLVAGGVSYLVWLLTETVYRYMLTLDMLAPLLILLCIGLLPGTLLFRSLLAVVAIAFIALTIQPGNWGRSSRWPDRMVSIDSSTLPETDNLMILMAGFDAYSYLLPDFSPRISFVRIQSRGFSPGENSGLTHLIRDKIKLHKGPLMLFIPSSGLDDGKQALKYFNLDVIGDCRTIKDNRWEGFNKQVGQGNYPQLYSLCDVKRVN